MIELETIQYAPAKSATVLMSHRYGKGPPEGYPSFEIEWLVYPCLKYHQRVRKDRDKGYLDNSSRRWIWKPFQNYKIVSYGRGGRSPTYYDQSKGYPPNNVYINKSALPGPLAAYWQWETLSGGPFDRFGEAGRFNAQTSVGGKINCPPFVLDTEAQGFVPKPHDWAVRCNEALRYMLPSARSDLSLLNSLYELKDFKSWLTLAARVKSAASVAGFIKQQMRKYLVGSGRGDSLRAIANSSSSGFLTWKFAVKPLISDIKAIHALLTSYKSRINDQVTRTGGLKQKHFTKKFREYYDSDETSQPGFIRPWIGLNGCIRYDVRRRIVYDESVFHAEVQYNYNYTGYQRQHAATLALLDRLGLNFNPRIVWDALPFSFVVDWVLKVGDALDNFGVRFMEPQINIHQFLWSIKRKRYISCDVGVTSQETTEVSDPDRTRYSLPGVEEEAYGRFTDYPPSPSHIMASGLSSTEFTLGAALVTAIGTRR